MVVNKLEMKTEGLSHRQDLREYVQNADVSGMSELLMFLQVLRSQVSLNLMR